MVNEDIFKIINTLIEQLPNEVKNVDKPLEIDLILDGGAFNGSYLIGALYFLKEMEKRNLIKIKRISGCSIGSLIGFLYIIDKLDLVDALYNILIQNFKEKYNFENYKQLKKYLSDKISYDNNEICNKVNNILFIKYNNIETGIKKIKYKYKNINDIINTIIRSSYVPYLTDGDIAYKNKYIDGINPYLFKKRKDRKIFFLDLSGLDKFTYILNIKNEKTNLYRILSGILDTYIFLTKKEETFMCSFVDEWGVINITRYYIRYFLEKIICFILYYIILIKKYTELHDFLPNIINYKIINDRIYNIFISLIKNNCL
jgi:hypothetical protein